ncbi:MAG: transglutaminase-like cysteine peptidase [Pseudomonadota bacterium]
MLTRTAALMAQLATVNSQVNRLPYRADPALYGRPDFWTDIEAAGAGDCEDYALAKRRLLLADGWPVSAVRLATCWTEREEYHAVLTVDLQGPDGAETWVLDNRFGRVQQAADLTRIGYRWDRRQSAAGRGWVAIAA